MNNTKQMLDELKRDGKINSYTYEEHWEVDSDGIWAGLLLIAGISIVMILTHTFVWVSILPIGLGLSLFIGGLLTWVHQKRESRK